VGKEYEFGGAEALSSRFISGSVYLDMGLGRSSASGVISGVADSCAPDAERLRTEFAKPLAAFRRRLRAEFLVGDFAILYICLCTQLMLDAQVPYSQYQRIYLEIKAF
jgi:hypothetical protein